MGTRGPALVRHETLTEMALDVLFSDGGRVEAPLYREGVVDESFGAGYSADHDFAFAAVGGDVDDEAAFRARLEHELATTAAAPVTEAELTRVKRRSVGGYLRSFDAPERAADLLGLDAKEATLAEALWPSRPDARAGDGAAARAARVPARVVGDRAAQGLTGASVGPPPVSRKPSRSGKIRSHVVPRPRPHPVAASRWCR